MSTVGAFERGMARMAAEQALSEVLQDQDHETGSVPLYAAERVLAAALEALAHHLPRGVLLSADDLHTLARDLQT